MVVLARLLTPGEIGIFAIATAILAIGHVFRDMGIAQYLIIEKDLTKEKIEAVLFLNWLACIFLAVLLVMAGDYASEVYNNEILTDIFAVLALNIIFIPLGTVAQSQIRRQMRFKRLAFIENCSLFVNVVLSIILALQDFGAMSLAYASLAGTIATLVLLHFLMPTKQFYMPNPKALKIVSPFIFNVGGANFLAQFTNSSQAILVGKFLSESAVAILDKAGALIQLLDRLIFGAIQPVLTPFFANLKNNNQDSTKAYLTLVQISIAFAWPFLFYLAYFADYLIPLFYGDQWYDAIELVIYLCLAGACINFSRFFDTFLISTGSQKIVFRLNLLFMIIRVLLLVMYSTYGLVFIVKVLGLFEAFKSVVTTFYLTSKLSFKLTEFISQVYKGIVVLLMSLLPLLIVELVSIELHTPLYFSLYVLIVCPFWLLGLKVTSNPLFKEVAAYLKKR